MLVEFFWGVRALPLPFFYEALIFLSWSLTLIHLIIDDFFQDFLIGAITAPTSLFLNAFASFQLPESLQKLNPLVPALKSNWLMMHVTVMLLSYATLISGCVLAIAFLFLFDFSRKKTEWSETAQVPLNEVGPRTFPLARQEKILQSEDSLIVRVFGSFKTWEVNHLETSSPSSSIFLASQRQILLNQLDQISFRAIGLGFPLLTLGILSGSVWANEAWGSYWSWDPKETWSLITWMIFAVYLHLRLTQKWKGFYSAILATIGFFVIWICFLGVNFVAQGLHSYGWFY